MWCQLRLLTLCQIAVVQNLYPSLIEGYGGGAITPMANLVDPSVDSSQAFGLPSLVSSYVHAGEKSLQAFTITETLWSRVELGYGYDIFNVGTLVDDIFDATSVDIGRDHVALHNFNLRVLVNKETAYLPVVTFGCPFSCPCGQEAHFVIFD